MASPAPNMADRTSEMMMGDSPIPFSQTQPKKTVKHQHQSTQYIPPPNGCTNANAQHLKPKIHLPRRPRQLLKGERIGVAANGYTHSSSGQPMPQKLSASSNESDILITMSIELEDPGSSKTITCICLGGANCHANDPNGPRNQMDGSHGEAVSRTKHVWYSEHGMYCQFEIILERAMSATHVAVILRMRTSPAYEEEFTKMDYPDARNEYGTS
ncbi:hypothetical protein SCLCIDRAFT_27024 [Scleroderma citrinum Foug A]|uniref:Uncharacterized protein n=1 Tax=Scleroderma citrinum Foug A TaxID=1036808 RepID=A0A0C3DUA5_9AGAM|nr:hypothetical protein SCLCIDRAFT_27024 [Scleroderma citrinum Foug A]